MTPVHAAKDDVMAMNEQYIDSIAQERLLSDDEEEKLAARIKVGDALALEKLTKANLRFVVSMANQYRGRGVGEDDLVSEGNIALMHAAKKFDATRGVRFVLFAAPYIRKAMEKAIEEQDGLNGMSRKERRKERHAPHPISLDQSIPVGSKSTFTLHSIIADANAAPVDGNLDPSILRGQICGAFTSLDEREHMVLGLLFGLYGEACTIAEAGERMGLKRERVRQIRNKALRKLRRRIKR